MKIWMPEQLQNKYQYNEDGSALFNYSKYWAPEKIDMLEESYAHTKRHVIEAFDLITWPDLDLITYGLDILLCQHPSSQHFNGCGGSFLRGDMPNGTILLFGRSTPIPRHMTHYIVAHELGHVVQGIYCREKEDIDFYLRLRHYKQKDSPTWVYDWQQLWAEDFRWLFSINSAHQNSWSMAYPPPNENIRDLMMVLIDQYYERREILHDYGFRP